jgi:hypothetical protein
MSLIYVISFILIIFLIIDSVFCAVDQVSDDSQKRENPSIDYVFE